jgi:sRNA-binding carbon storage regulator CsrA
VLVISRKEDEVITIEPISGLDSNVTLREAFSEGPIVIKVLRISGAKVCIAIGAPLHLKIWRGVESMAADCGPEGDREPPVVGGEVPAEPEGDR